MMAYSTWLAVPGSPGSLMHPSAFVDSSAEIGPGCMLGPKVRILSGARVGAYCVIGGMPEHRGFYADDDGEMVKGVLISHGARVFEFVTIHSGTKLTTYVGIEASVQNHSHVAHDCQIDTNATIGGHVSLAGHVIVMRAAIVCGGSCVHQWAVIGPYAFLGARSFLKAHIPPGEKWVGSPARPAGLNEVGLARAGTTHETVMQTFQDEFEHDIKGREL